MVRYSLDDVRTSLQDAAVESGEPLSVRAYQRWRREQSGQIPSISTVYTGEAGRYETWDDACRDANVESPVDEPNHRNGYTKSDIRHALQIAAGNIDGPLTIRAYESWRQTQIESYPSRTVIFDTETGRYESWNAACDAAGVEPGTPGRWSESSTA